MPKIAFQIPHGLGKVEAARRVKEFLPRVRSRYEGQVSNLEESWEDDCLAFGFSTFGFKVNGKMEVEEDRVAFDADLPFAARMFKGRIEQTIREEVDKLLS